MDKRILFIIPALPDFVPYVNNYFRIADSCSIDYDVICWNRRGDKSIVLPHNYTIYQHPTKDTYGSFKKLKEIYRFCRFVRKTIRGKQYKTVFTYTIADSIFLAPWLIKNYSGSYVFDIRDYSPMVDKWYSRWLVKVLLKNSSINVISSEGFLQWLPSGVNYTVCHNTELEKVKESIDYHERREHNGVLHVLTIGTLRNLVSNRDLIKALGNNGEISIDFVGDGVAVPALKQCCEYNHISNVSFYGRYRKADEEDFVRKSDLMNIILPREKVSDHLMSNRFYLSVRYRKPMIVNDGCFQAEMVRKYGLGLVASADSTLYEKMTTYWKFLDWEQYNQNCKHFLKDVYNDLEHFNQLVASVINSNS